MPRALSEWIAKTPDDKVPPRVRLRIWRRQCGASNFVICPLSGAILRSTAECQLDHDKALIEGGEHRESNLRFVQIEAHRAKTAREVTRKAKVDAAAKRHVGIRGAQTALAGRDRATRKAAEAERSRDRRGNRSDLPPRRLPPGFVSALER